MIAFPARGQNALEGDLEVHDPVMTKQGGTYYIFHTGYGVSVKSSEDRVHWDDAGNVFSAAALPEWHQDDIPDQDGHLWAPEIYEQNGTYYLYYSVSAWMNFNSSIGLATNETLDPDDPDYQWVDQGKVISFENGGEGVNVIDPHIFEKEDGSMWLFYGSYQAGLRMAQLDPETGHLMNDPPERTTITTALGEGVYVLKGPDDYYYIFASRGKCCSGLESTYQVVMGRSKTLGGPYLNKEGESWVDNNYSVFLDNTEEEPGRGHNGFFTENDTTFAVYHAYTRSADGESLLNIEPVYVDEDGWPTMEPSPRLFDRER